MSHQEFRERLARRLAWQRAAHDAVRDPRNLLPQLSLLRQWQARRLAESFADFLADPKMRPAAEFFLSDLYGDKDFSARDRDAARILPLMSRLLPDTLLRAATEAIELAVLSHALDAAVKKHGVHKLLRASRIPAQLAGLSELQAFLERGFTAFDALGGADEFLAAVSKRELAVSERLFGGHPDPFAQPNSSSR